ncbi:hypothetical protein [Helicobacter sp. T3_23-1056]
MEFFLGVFFGREFFGGFYMWILACLLCLVVVARFWLDFAFLSKSQNRGNLFYWVTKSHYLQKLLFGYFGFVRNQSMTHCVFIVRKESRWRHCHADFDKSKSAWQSKIPLPCGGG